VQTALPTTRRDLLAAGARLSAFTALASVAPLVAACGAPARAGGRRSFPISLAQWSLHRALFAGELLPLDFPEAAARDYDVHAVEYVNAFFKDKARDAAWLRELKARADSHGVTSLLIMVDGEGELGAADPVARARAVENHVPWLEAAAVLGCRAIRVNAAGEGPPDALAERAADSLVQLAQRGAPDGLAVVVENHGGWSSDGAWLAGVMRRARDPRVGTLPDFGNFRIDETRTYDRYRGVAELMPFAKAVSAKSYDFDADGNETTIDYERMLAIVLDAGYRVHVVIEYEGQRLPEPEGIRRTKALLERVLARLA
jgi:sugar phosphate isomerase/epimerase